jgi:3-dehydroquinate dehydratase
MTVLRRFLVHLRSTTTGGSCNSLVNVEVVKKLGLTMREHPHAYHIQWFNNNDKVKVTKIVRIHSSIGSYHDFADFDMVPTDACSFLLGRLGSLILMLFTMVDLISILSCIRERKLCCCQ